MFPYLKYHVPTQKEHANTLDRKTGIEPANYLFIYTVERKIFECCFIQDLQRPKFELKHLEEVILVFVSFTPNCGKTVAGWERASQVCMRKACVFGLLLPAVVLLRAG